MKGNKQYFKSCGATTTTETRIFQAKVACSIESLYVCNQEGKDSGIKLYLQKFIQDQDINKPKYKSTPLAKGNAIKKNETIQFITMPIFLEKGDGLIAGLLQSDRGSFVISYRELLSQTTNKDDGAQTDKVNEININ